MSLTLVNNAYYDRYVAHYSESSIWDALNQSLSEVENAFGDIDNTKENHRYQEDKWSIKEVLHHINDTERVMAYRALRVARGDDFNFYGFDQDVFNDNTDLSETSLVKLLEEFKVIRKSTIYLFDNFTKEQLVRVGRASDSEVNAASLGYIMCGHALHHCRIVTERYL